MARSDAQQAADSKYEGKRKAAPRIPAVRLTEEESAVMNQLYGLFKSKSEAILAAAKYYLEKNKK